ncbi:MAG: phosphatase PAP2 family protein [Candidatus Saccharimonadales bacterium]
MKDRLFQVIERLRITYLNNRTQFIIRCVVLLLVALLLVTKRTFWTPDTLFVILFSIFVVFGQVRPFLVRFLPLVSLLLLYELFRGVADDLNGTVHFTEMIIADRWLFNGIIPSSVLQAWWWNGQVRWYDFYFYFLYTIHFLMPIILAVILWKKADRFYWPFVWAIVGLSFAAFVTYIVFPAAPPWMAKELGYFADPMHRVSSDIWAAMGIQNFSEVYNKLPANPVAAVPSLHSAYPLLFSLFVVLAFGRKYWWVFVYPISMWVGVVYLGEHYVIDVILGALYAGISVYASLVFIAWYRRELRKHPLRYVRSKLPSRIPYSTKA